MIEKMKFLSITGPKTDIDRTVDTYLSKYEIHLENALSELSEVAELSPFLEINPYKEDLSAVNGLYEELENPETLTPRSMSTEEALKVIRKIQSGAEELTNTRKVLEAEHDTLRQSLRIIRPFRTLDFKISDIIKFQYIHCRFGRIEKIYFRKFEKFIYDSLDTIFIKCEETERYVYGIYFIPAQEAQKVHAVYASMHFEQLFIPNKYQGTAVEAFTRLDTRHKEVHAELDANKEAWIKYFHDNASDIVSAKAALEQYSSKFDVRRLAACTKNDTDEIFYILCGWMSEKDAASFQNDIKNDSNVFCILGEELPDASKQPPTKLKNFKLFKPFEMYVKMYGLPAYNELDPTWFVAITYSFIFGAMFGDVGQGLCLFLGGLFLYKKKKMDLAGIISCAGVFSVFFGFMYGSFFGFEEVLEPIWLKPMTAMTTLPLVGRLNVVFVVAIAFGMGIILLCMIFNIINSIRTKDVEKTWFDSNAVAGLVFYGAVVATIVLFMTGRKLPGTAVLIIMFGIPLILMFLKEPLTNLVKKNPEILPADNKGPMFFVQSFFELFEVMLSYLSNTLSFLRVGAFAVSHAAMMEVVLMLAGAANGGTPNWIVIILGNIFVSAMEGLIVGIQVLRLEYYELFSRFYHGNGREFRPFLAKTAGQKNH